MSAPPSCKASATSGKDDPKGKGSLMSMICGGLKDRCNNNKPPADNCEKEKCPPMPCFNTGDCKPAWLCNPPRKTLKNYPVPSGANILPISKTGRNGSGSGGSGKCSSCGRSDDRKGKGPEVKVKDCPMMKPKCPSKGPAGAEKKDSASFFAKITSFFNKDKDSKDKK